MIMAVMSPLKKPAPLAVSETWGKRSKKWSMTSTMEMTPWS